MIMIDQSRRLREPLRWTRAGRLGVALTAFCALVAVALLVVVVAAHKPAAHHGCIDLTFPSTLGAAAFHQCGGPARRTCATPAQNPGLTDRGALRAACLRAGLPYG